MLDVCFHHTQYKNENISLDQLIVLKKINFSLNQINFYYIEWCNNVTKVYIWVLVK